MKQKDRYILWQIKTATDELRDLCDRMDDRERQQQELLEEQEQNNG